MRENLTSQASLVFNRFPSHSSNSFSSLISVSYFESVSLFRQWQKLNIINLAAACQRRLALLLCKVALRTNETGFMYRAIKLLSSISAHHLHAGAANILFTGGRWRWPTMSTNSYRKFYSDRQAVKERVVFFCDFQLTIILMLIIVAVIL